MLQFLVVVALIGLLSGRSQAEVEPLHPKGIAGLAQDVPSDVYGVDVQQRTSDGRLDGKQFTSGLLARSTSSVRSSTAGVRSSTASENTTRYFGAVLKPTDSCSIGAGGTGALNITGTQIGFQIDLHNVSGAVTAVELMGPATRAIDLSPYWWGNNSGRGILNISVEMQQRIEAGLASFVISTQEDRSCLTGNLEEGFIAFLGSAEEVPPVENPTIGSGTVFLYFTLDGTVNIEISLNNLTSPLTKAHLHAPAYPGNTSAVRFDMTDLIEDRMRDGSWHVSAQWKNVSAESLRFFQEGLYYFNMHTASNPSGELRGQLSETGSWYCPSSDGIVNQCYWVHLELSPNVSFTSDTRTPYGVAGVVIDRTERFQYSVALWYMPSIDAVLRLMGPNGTELISHVIGVTDGSAFRDHVREGFFVYSSASTKMLSEEVLGWMADGLMWFNVTTASNPSGFLNGSIPPLERNKCAQPSYTVPVGGNLGWTVQTFYGMRQLQWDALNFTFSAPDDVQLFENQNHYTNCQFGESTSAVLAPPPSNGQPTTYYFNLSSPRTYYFGSNATCSQGTKVVVTAVEAVNSSDITSPDVCNMSVYAATKDQRYLSSGGSNVVAAVIVGLLLGVAFVGGMVVLQLFLDSRRTSRSISHKVSEETSHDTYHKTSHETPHETSHETPRETSDEAPHETSHDASQEKKQVL